MTKRDGAIWFLYSKTVILELYRKTTVNLELYRKQWIWFYDESQWILVLRGKTADLALRRKKIVNLTVCRKWFWALRSKTVNFSEVLGNFNYTRNSPYIEEKKNRVRAEKHKIKYFTPDSFDWNATCLVVPQATGKQREHSSKSPKTTQKSGKE